MKSILKQSLCTALACTMLLGTVACSGTGAASSQSSAQSNPASVPAESSSQASGEKIKLNLWHQWTTDTDAMRIATDKAVKDYMAEHQNVEIETHMLENEAYKTKISTEFAGSASGIDLFFYWGGGRGGKLEQAGKLLPVGDYLTKEQLATIKPGADKQFTYDGKLYATPIYSWYLPLYCNTELFDKAGAKIPTTYAELLEACKKLSAAGVKTPLAQGVKESWQAAFVFESLSLREVGAENILKLLGNEIKFNDPGYLEAAKKTQELYKAGAFGKNPTEVSSADADQMFLTGKAAMRLQGNWFTESIYVDKNTTVKDKVKAVAFPMFSKGKDSDYVGGFIDSIFVNKNTAHPKEAVDFDIFLCKRLAQARDESGQGFSGFTDPVDESKLQPVAKQVADLANKGVNGVIAWDTALDENTATTHLEQVQSLFTDAGNPQAVYDAHVEAMNNR